MLNTIAAQSIDELSDELEARWTDGAEVAEAVLSVVKDAYAEHKRIVFNGDNYTDEWHAEAESRGLSNLRQTPDALPALISESAIKVMGDYDVLSERELESRFEVFVEQYIAKLNIECETTFSMAKTMLLPAAIRYLGELGLAGDSAGVSAITRRGRRGSSTSWWSGSRRWARRTTAHPAASCSTRRSTSRTPSCRRWSACARWRTGSSAVVPDSLWPLPKYSEILFIK